MSENIPSVPKDEFPRVSITGDLIVLRKSDYKTALIKRLKDPYAGAWAVIGGFFNAADHHGEKMDVSIPACVVREAMEEGNIDVDALVKEGVAQFFHLGVADAPNRDPRGRVVTMIFVLIVDDKKAKDFNPKAGDDAGELQWFDLMDVMEDKIPLAFDHSDYFTALAQFLAKSL